MEYFVIHLENEVLSFSKKCNSINYKDPNYLVCKHNDTKGYDILAIIPHSKVVRIVKRKDD